MATVTSGFGSGKRESHDSTAFYGRFTPPVISDDSRIQPPAVVDRLGSTSRRLIELYTYRGDLVLDPFVGSGTTALAALETDRHYVGSDTEPEYIELANKRLGGER